MPSMRLCFIPICIIRSRLPRRLGVNPDSGKDGGGLPTFPSGLWYPFCLRVLRRVLQILSESHGGVVADSCYTSFVPAPQ